MGNAMTNEERMREAAIYLRGQYPRPCSCGLYVDELLVLGADELRGLHEAYGRLALSRYPSETAETASPGDAVAVERMKGAPMSGKA